MKPRKPIAAAAAALVLAAPSLAGAATMYSNHKSFGGPGIFYGPGATPDSEIFEVTIHNIGLQSGGNFITPMLNNGGAEPNICAERELGRAPTGMLSDGTTRINENVDVCAMKLNNLMILAAVVDGGPHGGQQISVTLDEKVLVMTMDFALDLGMGKSGVMRFPFYGTTDEVTVPFSLQTQMGLPGGVDKAGSLPSGTKLKGRLGDFNGDGFLDGSLVVAGNLPLDSIFMPGAPYALIRNFDTDIPIGGKLLGKLPGKREQGDPPPLRVNFTSARLVVGAQAGNPAPSPAARTAAHDGRRP
ncbi:MAG TPA: hypothetical protein VI356_21365 [Myxococcales bacterium]